MSTNCSQRKTSFDNSRVEMLCCMYHCMANPTCDVSTTTFGIVVQETLPTSTATCSKNISFVQRSPRSPALRGYIAHRNGPQPLMVRCFQSTPCFPCGYRSGSGCAVPLMTKTSALRIGMSSSHTNSCISLRHAVRGTITQAAKRAKSYFVQGEVSRSATCAHQTRCFCRGPAAPTRWSLVRGCTPRSLRIPLVRSSW